MRNAVGAFVVMLLSFHHATAGDPQTKWSERFVDIREIDSSIIVSMMYATNENFTGQPVPGYAGNICYLTIDAADALHNAQKRLAEKSKEMKRRLTLMVRDCYRPKKAVDAFVLWVANEADTKTKERYYPRLNKADLIAKNFISPVSGHSRGSSVDITLAEIGPDGEANELAMGTPVDFFGDESKSESRLVSAEAQTFRKLLKEVMSPEFKNYSKEWWHFALKKEPFPATMFDFDVAVAPARTPNAIGPGDISTHFTAPDLLAELDSSNQAPLSLFQIFTKIHAEAKLPIPVPKGSEHTTARVLSDFKETYGVFAQTLSNDVSKLISNLGIDWEKDITKTYQVSAAKTEAGKKHRGNGNVTRIFNEKWLSSPDGQMILSGIVNRIDRKDFEAGRCGEVRFIYRLGYAVEMAGETYASRMPFTLNAVFSYDDDGHECRDIARLWRADLTNGVTGSALATRLLEGPLNFSRLKFKQLEVNAQVARFPSDLENVEERRFAGQAIYLMRIFKLAAGGFVPRKLENTPDVLAISKDPAKQKELKEFLAKNLSSVDTGAFLLPESLLADVALSYSTLGSSRMSNRPFDLLLNSQTAQEIVDKFKTSKAGLQFIASGKGLLERLNTSSCMGCHQSSSTAGFHFLGLDRSDFGAKPQAVKTALDGNRLQLPFSPHLYAEISRRSHYLSRVANGERPNILRPHPSAPGGKFEESVKHESAKDNMPCPLAGEKALGPSASWVCDSARGLTCQALVTNSSVSSTLGQCVPKATAIYSGLSCRKNAIQDSLTRKDASAPVSSDALAFNVAAFKDRVVSEEQIYALTDGKVTTSAYNCRPTKIGVPLGRVTKNCSPAEMTLKTFPSNTVPDEYCAVVGGKGFEEMAKGYFSSKKFAEGVGRGLLNSCSPHRACREDYICQEMPDFLTSSRFNVPASLINNLHRDRVGFCTPTYFVYQLRLDGHPNPR